MINERINLKDYFSFLTKDVYLTSYCPSNFIEFSVGRKRKTVLVLPGGGYEFLSEREKEPIAIRLMKDDFNAFTLEYNVGDIDYPNPFIEAFAALIYIRKNLDKYNVDIDKIAVIGFSAGGHLAASLGVLQNDEEIIKLFNEDKSLLRINALALSYPVITMDEKYTHMGSRIHVTKEKDELIKKLSIEKQIDSSFPATFIWLTAEDDLVHPFNSLLLAQELIKNNVKVELHMYARGHHGLALSNNITAPFDSTCEYKEVVSWFDHLIDFLNLYL